MTRQRAAVLDVIRSDMCHHTADEIFRLAGERLPGISRATVYNSLRELERAGLIRRITGESGADRYDSSYIPHGHAICTDCGRVWDFNIEGFDETILSVIGREFESYELKVRVLCDACRGEQMANGD